MRKMGSRRKYKDHHKADWRIFLPGPRFYILTKTEVEYFKTPIEVTHIHSQLRVDVGNICSTTPSCFLPNIMPPSRLKNLTY